MFIWPWFFRSVLYFGYCPGQNFYMLSLLLDNTYVSLVIKISGHRKPQNRQYTGVLESTKMLMCKTFFELCCFEWWICECLQISLCCFCVGIYGVVSFISYSRMFRVMRTFTGVHVISALVGLITGSASVVFLLLLW